MERLEREQYITIICNRIGTTALYIQELMERQSELNSYYREIQMIEKMNKDEKSDVRTLIEALCNVDENYKNNGSGLSKINYGIFQNWEKEVEKDIQMLQRLRNKHYERKGRELQRKREKERIEKGREQIQDIQMFCKIEGLSLFFMFWFTIALFFVWNRQYEFSVIFPSFWLVTVIGGGFLILYQLFRYSKMKIEAYTMREEELYRLEKEEEIEHFREEWKKEEIALKYMVDDCEELEDNWQLYHLQKKLVLQHSLFAVRIGVMEFLNRKGLEHSSFFVYFPMCFLKETEFRKLKLYIENRKEHLENNLYHQIMGQKSDLEEMKKWGTKYPVLREYIQTALNGYGITI